MLAFNMADITFLEGTREALEEIFKQRTNNLSHILTLTECLYDLENNSDTQSTYRAAIWSSIHRRNKRETIFISRQIMESVFLPDIKLDLFHSIIQLFISIMNKFNLWQ